MSIINKSHHKSKFCPSIFTDVHYHANYIYEAKAHGNCVLSREAAIQSMKEYV